MEDSQPAPASSAAQPGIFAGQEEFRSVKFIISPGAMYLVQPTSSQMTCLAAAMMRTWWTRQESNLQPVD
jgi:hypothetical protein